MPRPIPALALLSLLALAANPNAARAATPIPTALSCEHAITAAERRTQTAPGLLRAIGLVESGRSDNHGARRPWPWTVTAEGVGTYYPSKEDAIAAVQSLQARGIASIDVGCMQVNLQYHPAAFASLDDAFDPAPNTAYAARFLLGLHAKLDDWEAAAAAYHSQTPALGAPYAKLVAAVWSGAPVPVTRTASGEDLVRLPGGSQMRIFRTADPAGRLRVFGVLN